MDLKADQTQLRNELIKQKISQQHREQKNTEKTGNSERDTDMWDNGEKSSKCIIGI